MGKSKKNIFAFTIILVIVLIISFLILNLNLISKLVANTSVLNKESNTLVIDGYPVINFVINSSGEKFTNDDVAITVNASSNYKINLIEYSYDLKKWETLNEKLNENEINAKLVFEKSMDKTLYIRVQNEKGYKSYPYKTYVKIDKEKPTLEIDKENNEFILYISDNNKLSNIQYSNDKINWESFDISGEAITLRQNNFEYKYIRVVDSVGNISNISKIKEIY